MHQDFVLDILGRVSISGINEAKHLGRILNDVSSVTDLIFWLAIKQVP